MKDEVKKEERKVKCACPGCGRMVMASKDDKPVYCTPEHAKIAKTIEEAK